MAGLASTALLKDLLRFGNIFHATTATIKTTVLRDSFIFDSDGKPNSRCGNITCAMQQDLVREVGRSEVIQRLMNHEEEEETEAATEEEEH